TIAAALLVAPPVVLLGTVVPQAVRLRTSGLEDVGGAVGKVCGIFAVGGVASALLLWFVLIPRLGVIRVALLTGLLPILGGAAALEVTKRLFPRPGRLMIVGLRGGSVAKSFARDGWTVTVLETQDAAARAARDHFALRASEARVFSADAREFFRRDNGVYDL